MSSTAAWLAHEQHAVDILKACSDEGHLPLAADLYHEHIIFVACICRTSTSVTFVAPRSSDECQRDSR